MSEDVKRGRPKKEKTKDAVVNVRVTDKEIDMLDETCLLTGKSRAEIIREGLRMACNLHKFNT